MVKISGFLKPHELTKLSNLELLARTVVEGFCAGLHRSPHKGFSIEFKQHRQYVSGDDLRYLDWKIFGKSDKFFIKEYEEETNLRSMLLVDASGSMAYGGDGGGGGGNGSAAGAGGNGNGGGGGGEKSNKKNSREKVTKFFYATRLAACFAYLMLHQQDSVGLVTFDTKIRTFIPSRARPKHLQLIIDGLASRRPGGETSLSDVFRDIVSKIQKRGLLIIFSDCFDNVPNLLSALTHFRHVGHDIILFQVWDRDELDFPFKQWTRFECLERPGLNHLVDPVHLKAAYLEKLEEYREALVRGCYRLKIDLVQVCTDQPYAEVLARYLGMRKRRI